MVRTDPLTQLNDARARNVPWHVLLDALRRLEMASRTDERGLPWVKVAAERSGYTINQLRQMDRVMEALEDLTQSNPRLSTASALTLPFSHLELIARLAKIDREAAEMFLSEEKISGGYTYRSLRDVYYQARAKMNGRASPMSVGKQSVREFAKICYDILSQSNNLRRLHGNEADPACCRLLKWPGGFNYANPDFVIIDETADQIELYGIDCLLIFGDVNQDITVREVLRASVESTFFNKYFVCLPAWSPIWLFEAHKNDLGLGNVGIVSVNENGMSVAVEPEGKPYPDRRSLLRDDRYVMGRMGKSSRKPT